MPISAPAVPRFGAVLPGLFVVSGSVAGLPEKQQILIRRCVEKSDT